MFHWHQWYSSFSIWFLTLAFFLTDETFSCDRFRFRNQILFIFIISYEADLSESENQTCDLNNIALIKGGRLESKIQESNTLT